MRQLLFASFCMASLAACRPASEPHPRPATAPPPLAPAASPAPAPQAWLENTPEAAFAAGKRQGQLVLADLWAPWCHTCLSMQASVLNATSVPELKSLVLLAIDTEREQNATFLAKYPIGVWPTFYLLDPQTGGVRGRWLGAATPAELSQWLRDSSGDEAGAERLAREGDALAASRSLAEAATRYREALTAAPASWPRRATTLVSLLSALSKQRSDTACLDLAVRELASLPASVAAVDFASTALGCAERASTDPNARRLQGIAERTLSRDCEARAPDVSVDDQADACGNLRRAREALGDGAGAARAAEQGLAVISAGSAGAPPEVQAIYDWERSASLLFLGRAAEAEALLVERERQLPQSYNPPHYLARLYRDARRWDDGLAAIERALAKAYGPRRVGLLGIKAELLKGKGQLEAARQVLERQLADYRALPAGQRHPDAEAAVQKRIESLTLPPATPTPRTK